ncbi:MAG TPA: hypothetical protein VIG99_28165 [Myxococcaceae bacterium]|jgi:hypothetical protein
MAAGGFRELGAWRFGMELAVLVFDLTAQQGERRDEGDDALRLAALEVPQRIAAGATDGRPRAWLRYLELAYQALDRLEAEAKRRWMVRDLQFVELVTRVRNELDALEEASRQRASAAASSGDVELELLEEAA